MNQRVCVVGATGYSGAELCALLKRHRGADIIGLFATQAGSGSRLGDLHPSLAGADGPEVRALATADVIDAGPDCVFLATPEATSAEVAPALHAAGIGVIDLSGAFRLRSPGDYARWYGMDHPSPHLLVEARYGLTEWSRPALAGARLVANPGCYPTALLLALKPIAGRIDSRDPIICDAMSGVSGAGRRGDPSYSFAELSGNFKAYNVGRHRHEPEMRAGLGLADDAPFTFVAHLLPAVRGILATIHVSFAAPLTGGDLAALYDDAYRDAPLVRVLPEGDLPELRQVVGTPRALIGFVPIDGGRRAVIVSAIDNLLKGAASQAIQNFNLRSGFDECEGLAC